MPKTDKKVDGFEFVISGVPPGTTYSLYLQDNPRRYSQGTIQGNKLLLEIPSSFSGAGYVTITTPRVDRLIFGTTITSRFTLDKDININLAQEIEIQTTPQPLTGEGAETPKKKLIESKLKKQVQAAKEVETPEPEVPEKPELSLPKKKLLTNKLQEQVQEAKKEAAIIGESKEERDKKTFWDRFK